MINNDNDQHNYPHHTEQAANAEPKAYKVEDDDNLEEKDLKRTFLFGDSHDANPDQPGYESHGEGGQNFGKSVVTTSGDDSANPSQNAGYSNDYFKRTEPLEEHPENNNFKTEEQMGEPTKTGEGEASTSQTYQEGTADYDGGTHADQPGNENPNQAKIGESNISEPGKADYKPEYDQNKPDYGSNSPDDNAENPPEEQGSDRRDDD